MTFPNAIAAVSPSILIERRSRLRFSLELKVQYRTRGRSNIFGGTGSVVNISSDSVLVAGQHQIRPGTRVDLSIEWPFLLEGRIPLHLVTSGKVVRSGTSGFAVVLAGYQFRTKRKTVVAIDAARAHDRHKNVKHAASG
jgi:hypothetical protein